MVSFFYKPRTDFAFELISDNKQGYKVTTKKNNEIITTKIVINDRNNALNREIGTYYSIEFDNINDKISRNEIIDELTKDLKNLLKEKDFKYGDSVLVVGLGNKNIKADALGPETANKIYVTNHIFEIDPASLTSGCSRVYVLIPGVMGQTGMESANIVKSIVDSYNPDLVIAIDALATKSTKRLFKSIQLASSGIAPGSGVNNKRLELSYETLGCHVLAIGVPTVVDIVSIFNEYNIEDENLDNNFFLTSKEVDDLIKHTSIIISKAINISLLDLK